MNRLPVFPHKINEMLKVSFGIVPETLQLSHQFLDLYKGAKHKQSEILRCVS